MLFRFLTASGFAVATLAPSLAADALPQERPVIDHVADECWPEDQFPQLAAGIQPGREIVTAKVYFRSDKYPEFYYVVMTLNDPAEHFLAILPKPGPETERVIYYVEAVDRTFSGARTVEYDPKIEDPCFWQLQRLPDDYGRADGRRIARAD